MSGTGRPCERLGPRSSRLPRDCGGSEQSGKGEGRRSPRAGRERILCQRDGCRPSISRNDGREAERQDSVRVMRNLGSRALPGAQGIGMGRGRMVMVRQTVGGALIEQPATQRDVARNQNDRAGSVGPSTHELFRSVGPTWVSATNRSTVERIFSLVRRLPFTYS